MSTNNNNSFKDEILDVFEACFEAQLRAVRRLKRKEEKEVSDSQTGMSQVDMAYDVLKRTGTPLHVNEIIKQIQVIHNTQVDRESLVSALIKKVKRNKRFTKTGKNTFKITS